MKTLMHPRPVAIAKEDPHPLDLIWQLMVMLKKSLLCTPQSVINIADDAHVPQQVVAVKNLATHPPYTPQPTVIAEDDPSYTLTSGEC